MSLKRIAIFTPNFPPELGACALRMYDLVKRLQDEGHQVYVYTTLPNYPNGKIAPSYRRFLFKKWYVKENIDGIPVFRFLFFPSNSSSSWIRLMSMCSLMISWLGSFFLLRKQRPTIFFVQSPPILAVFSVWLLAKMVFKQTLVLNLSDLYPQVLKDLNQVKGQTIYNILTHFEKFIYKKADFILGQSNEIVAHVKQIIPSKPVFLYRNGIDTHLFHQKKNYEIPISSPIKLVYAGLLGVAQGMYDLIQTIDFEKLKAQFYIYGSGNEYEKIHAYIQKHNLEKVIFLEKTIPLNLIAQRLADFDVALIAQRKRILGTVPSKMYEAMAVGLPILLCGGGESAELVTKNNTGVVVEAGNYSQLEQAIIQLHQLSTQERELLGMNGVRVAKASFEQAIQFQSIRHIFT